MNLSSGVYTKFLRANPLVAFETFTSFHDYVDKEYYILIT